MGDKEKQLDRILKLIAMSASPHGEEARTSAYLACRAIREHGFRVSLAKEEPKGRSSGRGPEAGPPKWHRIKVKHAGRCVVCRLEIGEGVAAFWLRGTGVRHLDCDTKGTKHA
jgi:hypothetical protein